MSTTMEERVDLMKREIDALQIAVTASATPWYKQVSTIVSALALLFSFGTTFVSYQRTQSQDLEDMRAELRGVLQRLGTLPREHVVMKKFENDPARSTWRAGEILWALLRARAAERIGERERASSSEENIAVEKPADSNAALRGTAVERSSMVMRMRAGMGGKVIGGSS